MRLVRHLALLLIALVLVGGSASAVLAWHQGYRVYVVHTGSMVPTLRPGDAVLDRPSTGAVQAGEVVTFTAQSGPDSVVTHRVVSIENGVLTTKGDANATIDPWRLPTSAVVGSRVMRLPLTGYLLVFFRQPTGSISFVAFLAALICAWSLFFGNQRTGQTELERSLRRDKYLEGRHRSRRSQPAHALLPRHRNLQRPTDRPRHLQPVGG